MTSSPDYHIGSEQLLSRASIGSHPDDEFREVLLPPKQEYRDEPNTPRDPSPPPPYRTRRPLGYLAAAIQFLPWVFVISILAWMASALYYEIRTFKTDVKVLDSSGDEAVEVQHDTLPNEPTPVIVTDQQDQTRWTVSVPSWLDFPLRPQEYADLCGQVHNVSEHLEEKKSTVAHHPYYYVDEKFMEVAEAEEAGMLPTNPLTRWTSAGSGADSDDSNVDSAGYCKRSLTFNLETDDAGFGNTLMQVWMAYGLARKEGRAFFIDDRNWAYGRYKTYFQPPPDQGCLPPPEHYKLPCPHHAAHLVVSRGTQSMIFGHGFNEEFEDPKGMAVQRQRKMFAMLRAGYDGLFKLADADQSAVDARLGEIRETVNDRGGVAVGVHVRHGDNHPWEFAYHNGYVPLSKYVDVAWELAESAHNASTALGSGSGMFGDLDMSRMVLASDDPEVLWGEAMALAIPAQTQIRLGEDELLEEDKGTDDSSPWEGGFTVEKFWGLGSPAKHEEEEQAERQQRDFTEEGWRVTPAKGTLRLRERVGRAYVMDLAVLSQTDRVVCTVSSIGCRLLAVMMGWERAIEKEHWRNVDGEWFWKGIRW